MPNKLKSRFFFFIATIIRFEQHCMEPRNFTTWMLQISSWVEVIVFDPFHAIKVNTM